MRNHRPRTLLAVTAILSFTVQPDAPTVARDDVSATVPQLELVDMPAEFVTAAAWAVDLFAQAGFELPPLRYVFHGDNRQPCSGRRGLHHRIEGVNMIEICTSKMSQVTQGNILHETAHAWLEHTLTDERRATFQKLRGWTYWRNYDAAPWHDNGTEQAAEIMVWGLIDRPLEMVQINQNSCDELDAGYRVLTSHPPLHGFRDKC